MDDNTEYIKEELKEIKEMEQETKLKIAHQTKYMTFKVFKGMSTKIVVSTGLTEKEAQKEVKTDIEINPKAENYMLCYTKETNKI